jgi:cell division protein FtsI (penicillin-binding protein 3)/stage V sporulation protein D (sporulation-specific penicillin-binding protein)
MVQVVRHDTYVDLADKQYVKKTNSFVDRGTIYMTTKDGVAVAAATVKSEYVLYINAKSFHTAVAQGSYVNTKGEIITSIDDALLDLKDTIQTTFGTSTKIAPEVFPGIRSKSKDPYEEIAKGLQEDQVAKIKDLKRTFLGIVKEKKRYYPGGDLAPHVVGLLGYQGDSLAGRYGLEKQYEKTLVRGDSAYTNFFAELFSGAQKVLSSNASLEGDVYTTIEPTVQKELQRMVGTIQKKQSSDLTGAIIMDPYTGEIFALAETPSFDPEDTKHITDISVYKNDIVEGSHEMGSIIKPLTMAVGIDTGKVHADSTYLDAGFIKVRDRTIYNFDKKGRGVIDLQTALSQSLNTGFVHIAQLVGNDALTTYFKSFGLGQKTNIDLPDESAPLTQNLDKGDVEHATVSFGQGIAMTPIGTIRALSVLANGGHIIKPHVVQKVKHSVGTTDVTDIPKLSPENAVLKPSTIEEIKRMLVYNVDNALLKGARKNPRYSIAAKTGTAQIASKNGGYIEGKNIHTFIGFFPAYTPKYIVFIYTIDPKVSRYASESLADPFLDLTDFLIQYYQIPPDR